MGAEHGSNHALRLPRVVLAAALALSGAVNISRIEAAGAKCNNTRLLVVGVGYVNNPLEPNRPKQADPVDLAVGFPKFGIAVVDYIKNPKDPNSERVEIARGNLVNRGSYTSALFQLTGLSNTRSSDGSEAMEVAWYFNDDPAKPNIETVVKCGFTVPVWGGRSAPPSEIEKALNNPQYEFRTVASVVNEAMRTVTGQSAGLGPEKALQAEVRRALREFADQERARTLTPTITSTPTSTATATVTVTATSTPASISAGTAAETNAETKPVTTSGWSIASVKDWPWLPASIFGGSALLSLAILRGKNWRWPRRRAQTTNEVRVKVPDLVVQVNPQIEVTPPVKVTVKVPKAKVSIEGQKPKK